MAATESDEIQSDYQQRVDAHTVRESQLLAADKNLARFRVVAFFLLVLILVGSFASQTPTLWYLTAAALFACFVGIVAWHDQVERALAEVRLKRRLCRDGIARRRRRWRELQIGETTAPAAAEATSNDLDLFGQASLFQLASPASTAVGQSTLRDWMVTAADMIEIESRQLAVAELVDLPEIRERLQLLASQLTAGKSGPTAFIAWAEGDCWLLSKPLLLWAARLSPLAGVTALILAALGILPPLAGGFAVLAALALNAVLSVFFTGRVHEIFTVVSSRNGEALKYLEMFDLLHSAKTTSAKLQGLQVHLRDDQGGVLAHLSQLRRIMLLANISSSPLLFLLIYVPLQLAGLWDFHVLWRLEIWQTQNVARVRQWFDALGQFEALAGLGTLAAEHPQWSFPQIDVKLDRITAKNLGHPLLADDVRVGNDVVVGPPGSFLLVTGSNMSGKSTLLRSLGTNAVLARVGAPVCAGQLSMPPVEVATSMRVQDSLSDGVSFFMAELKRLKGIVDVAHVYQRPTGTRLLYLLDEILQGTNSRERQIAVSRVVRHLLDCRAIGAISTHDIELAASEGLVEACQPVHFRELLQGDSPRGMTFDYVMRPGVASTTNALKLLELVGLDEGGEGFGKTL